MSLALADAFGDIQTSPQETFVKNDSWLEAPTFQNNNIHRVSIDATGGGLDCPEVAAGAGTHGACGYDFFLEWKMSNVFSLPVMSFGARDGRLSAIRDVNPKANLSALIRKLLRYLIRQNVQGFWPQSPANLFYLTLHCWPSTCQDFA